MVKKVQLSCIIYLLAWLLCPPLMYGALFRFAALFCCVAWIFVEYIVDKKVGRASKNNLEKFANQYLIAAILYIGADALIQLLFSDGGFTSIVYNNLQVYILLIIGFIGTQYVAGKRWREIKIAFIAIVVFCVVFSVTAIFRAPQYQTITREAGGESKFSDELLIAAARSGVGGFGFFCFTAILVPTLVYFSKIFKGRKNLKTLVIVSAVICEVGVVSAGYMLALLISLVGIFGVFFITTKNEVAKACIILSLALILIFGQQLLEVVYSSLLKFAAGSMYENKVEDIFSFLIDGELEGTFDDRLNRYLTSLESIFKYPLFGSLIWANTSAIGSHSSILDSFAAYGWMVGGSWVYLIVLYHNQVMKYFKMKLGVRIVLISVIVLTGLFNRLVMMIGALYFILPFIAYYDREEGKNEGVMDSL